MRWLLVFGLCCLAWSTAAQEEPKDKRADVPDAAARKEALKLVHDVFKSEFAQTGAEEQKAFAEKLIKQGKETKDDPVTRYVLFQEAINLDVGQADVEAAFEAIDYLAERYKVDALALKKDVLAKSGRVMRAPEQFQALSKG